MDGQIIRMMLIYTMLKACQLHLSGQMSGPGKLLIKNRIKKSIRGMDAFFIKIITR